MSWHKSVNLKQRKLTDDEVRLIRVQEFRGQNKKLELPTRKELAGKLGVSYNVIQCVRNGGTYKDVK